MLSILSEIFTINNVLMMFIGVAAGIIIGVLPGLGTNFAITVLLTMTFGMNEYAGIYLLLGAYCGAMYGGSITAILINTPGTTGAVPTTFDGYPLAQQGRAGDALNTALYASVVGGIISALSLMFFAPQLAKVVLLIASPEYFCLCIFGVCAAISIAGDNKLKGFISAMTGLLVASVGMDPHFGTQRFVFGNYKLTSGFKAATCMLGAYALSTILIKCREVYLTGGEQANGAIEFKKSNMKFIDIFKHWKTLIRSSVIGVIIGAIPGTGGAISAMLSYNEARRASKHPERYGHGEIDGVAASECGNNAVTGSTLIPLLTMGIPGDSCMAILLGALTMQGITPGTALFKEGSIWVYAIMGGLIIINILMLIQGKVFIKLFANCARIPQTILMPCILVVCCMGAFALGGGSTYEIYAMLGFGVLGYLMKRFGFPVPPMTIGIVLGFLMEQNLRRTFTVYNDDWTVFFRRPICIVILFMSVLFMFLPQIKSMIDKKKKNKAAAVGAVE